MNEIEGIKYYEYGGSGFQDDFDDYLCKKYLGQSYIVARLVINTLRRGWGIDLSDFEGDVGREIFML